MKRFSLIYGKTVLVVATVQNCTFGLPQEKQSIFVLTNLNWKLKLQFIRDKTKYLKLNNHCSISLSVSIPKRALLWQKQYMFKIFMRVVFVLT